MNIIALTTIVSLIVALPFGTLATKTQTVGDAPGIDLMITGPSVAKFGTLDTSAMQAACDANCQDQRLAKWRARLN